MNDLPKHTLSLVDKVQERIRAIDLRRLEHLRRQRADIDEEIARLEGKLKS